MNTFPDNIREAIAEKVAEIHQVEKETWQAEKREQIFHTLVKCSVQKAVTHCFPFASGQYEWNTQIFSELVVNHDFSVQIFVRPQNTDRDKLLPFERWDEINYFDKIGNKAYAKIKL